MSWLTPHTYGLDMSLPPEYETFPLDPEWTVFRKFRCGHVQHACCHDHLDPKCPLCEARAGE